MPSFPVRARLVLLVILILLGGLVGTAANQDAPSTSAQVSVFAPDEAVSGATLAAWSARHWEWTLSFPVQINPGQDVTGATCGYGQTAPMFFVPRNFAPCRVPEGTAIFVPIVGTECSTVEPPPYHGASEADLRSCATRDVDRYTGIVVRVDGEEVPNIDTFRTSTPRFTVILPGDNVLGVPAGVTDIVADGYQLILAPLPVGDHEIMVHVELIDGTILPDKVMQLTVVGSLADASAATPTESPSRSEYDPLSIARIQASETSLGEWFDRIEDGDILVYVSDGNPDTITIPDPGPPSLAEHFDAEPVVADGHQLVRSSPD
ncbi:MAG: hypothetical protein M3457_03530 [Chloroflexota bacterium]|nr:hypothetical protein [Chloroflexota bacterium]